MPLTLIVAPLIAQEATNYAIANGTTLEMLVQDYLKEIAQRERERRAAEADSMFDFLMSQKGSLEPGYSFNREEANAR